jgi:putative flavoprotein involved in K+ transport
MSERERVDTLVIGAGQAGLATAYHLGRLGRECLVVDSNQRIGDGWRAQWDSLRLYSPARNDGLPGMPFPARRWAFPTKDEVADYLETYAASHGILVRPGTRVQRLVRVDDGFQVEHATGTFEADNVVVATGTFGRTPHIPAGAEDLDPRIRQLHSCEYRNPGQLQPGPVLVVGASHSGSDIAYEVAADHPVVLCGRDTGQIPVRLDSPMFRVVWPLVFFAFGHVLTRRTPMGRAMVEEERLHGAPFLRVKRADLAARGVDRVEDRFTRVESGRPVLGEERVVDVTNVIWCTGFRQDFGWIDLPVLGDYGWPLDDQGVVESEPGLYFTGLGFQSSMRSMLIGGAGADAERVARHIAGHRPVRRAAGSAA